MVDDDDDDDDNDHDNGDFLWAITISAVIVENGLINGDECSFQLINLENLAMDLENELIHEWLFMNDYYFDFCSLLMMIAPGFKQISTAMIKKGDERLMVAYYQRSTYSDSSRLLTSKMAR